MSVGVIVNGRAFASVPDDNEKIGFAVAFVPKVPCGVCKGILLPFRLAGYVDRHEFHEVVGVDISGVYP